MDFSQKSEKMLVKIGFLQESIFLLNFFGFLTFHPFEKNKKNPPQKNLGDPTIHLFDLNPKILFEKMDFWIFWQPRI